MIKIGAKRVVAILFVVFVVFRRFGGLLLLWMVFIPYRNNHFVGSAGGLVGAVRGVLLVPLLLFQRKMLGIMKVKRLLLSKMFNTNSLFLLKN